MAFFYQQAMDFAAALLERLRVPVHRQCAADLLSECDGGLRRLLGMEEDYFNAAQIAAHWMQERTVYKMTDQFLCRYIYFRLSGTDPSEVLLLGPYLSDDLSPSHLMELAERLQIPMAFLPQLTNYYASLPVFHDPMIVLSIVYTLGDVLWKGRGFHTVDVDYEQRSRLPSGLSGNMVIEQEDILRQMQQMEERYAYEDKLIEIVSKGLISQAEVLLSGVSQLSFQQRVSDTLRNRKNYCIICNTLLRKAAQQGGVHPFYIDRMSSHFARAIENSSTPDKCSLLIGEMAAAYCRLVHTHTHERYSSLVRKVMSYIDANLSGDLSLTALAQLMKITPSYLSALFHKETGNTLSAHIHQARMKAALQLFKTTNLQIQSVAQLCGFSDPNYFSKRFKRYFGITPQQLRFGQTVPPQQELPEC